MSKLLVRAPLSNLFEAQPHAELQQLLAASTVELMALRNPHCGGTDELGGKIRFAILQQHLDNFPKVLAQFFNGLAL